MYDKEVESERSALPGTQLLKPGLCVSERETENEQVTHRRLAQKQRQIDKDTVCNKHTTESKSSLKLFETQPKQVLDTLIGQLVMATKKIWDSLPLIKCILLGSLSQIVTKHF